MTGSDVGDGGVRNDLGGTIAGSSVQAGVVHGDVHFHHAVAGSTQETGPVVPRQLPGTVRHFTNRDVEQNALSALLDGADGANTMVISAIDGTAGIGKTTLALHWGHRMRERFPDGQLYVNLRGFDPAADPMPVGEALRGFLDALGVPSERIPAGTDARAALYRSVVHGRRLLVVLDNARNTEQVRPLLPGSSTCLVVVTSRSQLDGLVIRDGARRMTLDFLTTPEARALLASYLGQDRVDAEPEAVDELVRRCAHLPLALSVVASRAAATPTFPLAVLVAQLRDEQDRLDALDVGDDTGVRAVFSWSYRALSAEAARMFRLLGLPAGADISLGAATALAGLAQRPARRLLDELGRAHLLEEYLPGRYRFHDLLRAYAAECAEDEATDSDRLAAVRRLLDWYLHTAHNADYRVWPLYASLELSGTDVTPVTFAADAAALTWYDVERANLFAAIRQASAYSSHTHVWQLPCVLMHFCRLRGHVQDWHGALQRALTATRHLGDRRAEADIAYQVALACHDMARYNDAASFLQEALALYEEFGDRASAARTFTVLGGNSVELKRYHEAIAYLDRALPDIGREDKGVTISSMGLAHAKLARYDEAIRYYHDALAWHKESGDSIAEGFTLHNLGDAFAGQDRADEAIAHYRQAVAVRQRIGHRAGGAISLQGLGTVLRQTGDLAGARECWRQALAIFDDLGRAEADEIRARLSELDGTTA